MQASTGKILTEEEVKALDKDVQGDCHPIPADTKVDTIRKLQNADPESRKAALKSLARKKKIGAWYDVNHQRDARYAARRKKDKMAKKTRKQQRKKK